MPPTTFANRWNLDVIEEAYRRWRKAPDDVDESWRLFFEGFELAEQRPTRPLHGNIIRLIDGYRELGHLQAHLDPLSEPPSPISQLRFAEFDLHDDDLDRDCDTSHFRGLSRGTLRQLVGALGETYCRTIGVEYMHIQDRQARHWLQDRMEPARNRPRFTPAAKLRFLHNLQAAEMFEIFLHASYVGQKRFSLEGAETLIPMLDALVEKAADDGVKEIVMGMSHRGRLNVLANILGKPYGEIFAEFEDNFLPLSSGGDGDVKYHLGFSSDRVNQNSKHIHVSLTPNPSHLEAVNPIVEGRIRAKQQRFGDAQRTQGLPILIHGDAALAGQGVVAETLNLSQLPGFTTGGTLHIVVNNQIGFTTAPADARSTVYCTDVAKMIESPIFHVNAEDIEAAVYVTLLALDFRQEFHRDVFIDLVCYRRHGHNESDDPSYTQPIMVGRIKSRPNLGQIYAKSLMALGELSSDENKALDEKFQAQLQAARIEVKNHPRPAVQSAVIERTGLWEGLQANYDPEPVETGIGKDVLQRLAEGLTHVPDGFHAHPRIAKALAARWQDVQEGKPIDWALAESLAMGSLLLEGTSVRLCGQDSRRGTFSQRHAVLVDMQTAAEYCPLSNLAAEQAPFFAVDSPLSEYAVLGFELGYSFDAPQTLSLWEAQFGDFVNGAQVIIDQFLVSSQTKWHRYSGLTLLLPHGYEGQGPEHSSARLERFLQLCAEDNIQVCYPTTPGQYFHLLRRQMHRKFRRPLVIMTPKSLLRHRKARSPVEEFLAGHFREILDDNTAHPDQVRRVVLCSGKIFYDILDKRTSPEESVAVVRVEQFYPFEEELLTETLHRYRKAREIVWVQEEPCNMGGWSFMEPRLRALGFQAKYIGRDDGASPAVGSHHTHAEEQNAIVEAALGGQAPTFVRGVALADEKGRGEQDSLPADGQHGPKNSDRTGKGRSSAGRQSGTPRK